MPEFHYGSVTSIVERLHDVAMNSADPGRACAARLCKRLSGVLEGWMMEEKERGSDAVMLLQATNCGANMLMFSAIATVALRGKEAEMARHLREAWVGLYDSSTSELEKRR